MSLRKIVAEIREVAIAVMVGTHEVCVGNSGEEGKRSVGDVEPIDFVQYGLVCFQNECLRVEMGDGAKRTGIGIGQVRHEFGSQRRGDSEEHFVEY